MRLHIEPGMISHPGALLAEYIEYLDLTPTAVAQQLAIPVEVMLAILAGKASITVEIAAKLEPVLMRSAEFWMRLQKQWDDAQENLSDLDLYLRFMCCRGEALRPLQQPSQWVALFKECVSCQRPLIQGSVGAVILWVCPPCITRSQSYLIVEYWI